MRADLERLERRLQALEDRREGTRAEPARIARQRPVDPSPQEAGPGQQAESVTGALATVTARLEALQVDLRDRLANMERREQSTRDELSRLIHQLSEERTGQESAMVQRLDGMDGALAALTGRVENFEAGLLTTAARSDLERLSMSVDGLVARLDQLGARLRAQERAATGPAGPGLAGAGGLLGEAPGRGATEPAGSLGLATRTPDPGTLETARPLGPGAASPNPVQDVTPAPGPVAGTSSLGDATPGGPGAVGGALGAPDVVPGTAGAVPTTGGTPGPAATPAIAEVPGSAEAGRPGSAVPGGETAISGVVADGARSPGAGTAVSTGTTPGGETAAGNGAPVGEPIVAAPPIVVGSIGPTAEPRPGTESRPRDLYEAAYVDFSRGNYALAIGGFREFLRRHPDHPIADNAQYWIGEAYMSLAHRYQNADETERAKSALQEAVQEFHRVLERYPTGDKAAGAVYREALALFELQEPEQGRTRLEYLIQHFPSAPETRAARERIAQLDGR